MSESGSKGHKPLFSQTFLGAVIVTVVGGVLVWVVTNNFSNHSPSAPPPTPPPPTISPESDSDTPSSVETVSEVSYDGTSASGGQPAEGESHTDGESTQESADQPADLDSSTAPIGPAYLPVASPGSRRQTKQGFEFLLERCVAEGEDINCWFLVTNKAGQPKLSIYRDESWLNDQDNNRRSAWRVLESDGSKELNILQLRLPIDSPVRFGLHFQGLKKSVTLIRFLNLHIRGDDLGWRDVEVE